MCLTQCRIGRFSDTASGAVDIGHVLGWFDRADFDGPSSGFLFVQPPRRRIGTQGAVQRDTPAKDHNVQTPGARRLIRFSAMGGEPILANGMTFSRTARFVLAYLSRPAQSAWIGVLWRCNKHTDIQEKQDTSLQRRPALTAPLRSRPVYRSRHWRSHTRIHP